MNTRATDAFAGIEELYLRWEGFPFAAGLNPTVVARWRYPSDNAEECLDR